MTRAVMRLDLFVDPRLEPVWARLAPAGVTLRGLAAAVTGERAACAVVTDQALTADQSSTLARAVATVLGVSAVEVAAMHATAPEDLLRQWVNQAAQGTGRGVKVRLAGDPPSSVRVLVAAIDSSARELALRLASPYEPALPALQALLGGVDVTVEDAEAPTT